MLCDAWEQMLRQQQCAIVTALRCSMQDARNLHANRQASLQRPLPLLSAATLHGSQARLCSYMPGSNALMAHSIAWTQEHNIMQGQAGTLGKLAYVSRASVRRCDGLSTDGHLAGVECSVRQTRSPGSRRLPVVTQEGFGGGQASSKGAGRQPGRQKGPSSASWHNPHFAQLHSLLSSRPGGQSVVAGSSDVGEAGAGDRRCAAGAVAGAAAAGAGLAGLTAGSGREEGIFVAAEDWLAGL